MIARVTSQALPAAVTSSAAAQFFRLLYGRREGYVELAWIDGDPDDREHYVFHRTWFAYRPECLGELLAKVEEKSRQFGNVYVSVSLYTARRRNAPVLPGQVLVVDDCPADLPCSFSVKTSPHKCHAYFVLDQPASSDELSELAKRAAYALGGDKSGWDSEQLVRVPGTYNTKARHGGRHLVTLQLGLQRRYSASELRTMWPEVPLDLVGGEPLDWPEVEQWLGNLGALLGANGLPRRVRPTSQTGQVLAQALDDTSLARYIVAKGLAMHGYPDAEIAALLWHFCHYDKAVLKGTAWLKADIQRIIAKLRASCPDFPINPTRARGAARPQPIAEQKPARRGRKITLTPAALLQWYEGQRSCSDVIMLTVAEVAERLGVSRATVERCERALRAEGQIERRTFNRRQTSLVALLGAPVAAHAPEAALPQAADRRPLTIHPSDGISPATPTEAERSRPLTIHPSDGISPATPTESADLRPLTNAAEPPLATPRHVPSAEWLPAQQDAADAVGFTAGGTPPREGPPPAAGPAPLPAASRPSSPRTVVAEAFAHFARRKRISRQMVVMFVESKYPDLEIADNALDRLIKAERQQRTWAQQVERLSTLKPAKLKSLSRMIDRVLTEGPDGPEGAQLAWAMALSPHVAAELERRAELRDKLDPQRRRREREEFMALAERAFRRQKAEGRLPPGPAPPPQAGARAARCSPQHAPTQHELFSCGTETQASGIAGMVSRLERLKERRGAVSVPMGRTEQQPRLGVKPFTTGD